MYCIVMNLENSSFSRVKLRGPGRSPGDKRVLATMF